MNLQDIDNAVEHMCFQLAEIPVYSSLDAACKSGTVAAELGNALATLLTARKLYEKCDQKRTEKILMKFLKNFRYRISSLLWEGGSDEAEE